MQQHPRWAARRFGAERRCCVPVAEPSRRGSDIDAGGEQTRRRVVTKVVKPYALYDPSHNTGESSGSPSPETMAPLSPSSLGTRTRRVATDDQRR
jgi:hypothetical protein